MEYAFTEIFDIPTLTRLCQRFTDLRGNVIALLDIEGNVHVATGWKDICTKFHRVSPECAKRCTESDTVLAGQLEAGEKYNLYKCRNGLVDVAVPVMVDGEHVGNFFTGQFLFEEPDRDRFREQAHQFGFDETDYLDALDDVPILDEEDVRRTVRFLVELTEVIGEMGMERLLAYRSDALARHKLEEQVAARTEELKQSNRELEQFAYVASHDLQEPLRKVTAFGSLLKDAYGEKLEGDGIQYLARMLNAAERMQQLINDLLTYSRVSTRTKPFVAVDMKETVRDVLSDLEIRVQETGAIIDVGDLPTVEADPTQMRQLMQNLIGNAMKYQSHGETPHVEVLAEATARDDTVPEERHGSHVRILVKDNGIGFDEKHTERIFGLFQRLHQRQEYSGTGIGLAVCRRIAERHGGTITATSQPGKGSTFTVTLPRIREE